MVGTPLVYIVVLNYNGYKDTVECIESLKTITYKNCKVIVVDNNSTDGSYDKLKSGYPELDIIKSAENLGYAGGNNLGIKKALENKADYVCIINNDVVVEPSFLETVISKMENDNNIGIAGSKVCEYYDRVKIQSTGSRIDLLRGNVYQINPGTLKDSVEEDMDVDYISGSCLVARKDIFEKIGLLPEVYFLFFEETEWCLRAWRAGYKVRCICDSVIYHKGSSTIDKISGIKEYYMLRNNIIFEKRNAAVAQLLIFLTRKTMRVLFNLIRDSLKGTLNKNALRAYMDGMMYKRSYEGIYKRIG